MKFNKTNVIGAAITLLVLLACGSLVAYTFAKQNAALAELRKLEAATQIGIGLLDYSKLLVDAKPIINEAATPRYTLVFERYRLAGEVWRAGFQNSGQVCASHFRPGVFESITQEIWGKDLPASLAGGCHATNALLHPIWKQANRELAKL